MLKRVPSEPRDLPHSAGMMLITWYDADFTGGIAHFVRMTRLNAHAESV
jgi:hypothetical protein